MLLVGGAGVPGYFEDVITTARERAARLEIERTVRIEAAARAKEERGGLGNVHAESATGAWQRYRYQLRVFLFHSPPMRHIRAFSVSGAVRCTTMDRSAAMP
ncbi:hypothetical protein [Streptomyces sp. NPDC086519]|uniref:hypothetical protein n=1 Tax=Streptomyces sp. NPDC086519 TaxID=3154863 RepID=UPI0034446A4B